MLISGRIMKNPVLLLASVVALVGLATLNVVRNGHAALLGLGYPWYSNPDYANPAESRYLPNGYSQSYPLQTTSSPRLMYIPYSEDNANSIAEPASTGASLASTGLQYSLPEPATSAYSPKAEPLVPFAAPSSYPEQLQMENVFKQQQVNFHP